MSFAVSLSTVMSNAKVPICVITSFGNSFSLNSPVNCVSLYFRKSSLVSFNCLLSNRGHLEPLYHALVTFSAFFLFGLFPLISFLLPSLGAHQLLFSCVLTGIILFLTDSLRILIKDKHWFWGGIEMLLIGGLFALIAYCVGVGFDWYF